jgi:hypothetical protein
MKILRKGASADHGMRSVELKPSKLKWNGSMEAFDLTFAAPARDFATPSRHSYRVRQTPAEMAAQLSMLAEAAEAMDLEDFSATFAKVLPALFRLQAMASGVKLST